MFDQYLHKPAYGSFGSEETYSDLQAMGTTLPQQEGDAASSAPHTHAHHTQAMYTHQDSPMYSSSCPPAQMGVPGPMGAPNPQFPPQNLYIPPISQNSMDPAQTSGYMGHPGCGPPAPIYTSAGPGLHVAGVPQGPHMMGGGVGMMGYYPRQPMVRNGGSPNSGGSPSPGSEDSDDSTPLAQMARAKRPSSESVEGPARGKKPKVSKKSKKKKDPNEPQKPVSAYALFFRDTQAAIKGSNPNASFGEVSKIVASMWDSLDADHKNVYKKKTEAAKKEYLKALAAYRASLVSKGEGEGVFGGQGYQFAPGFGYPPTTSTPVHPQVQSPTQMSPLAKKSPLLSSLMADPPPPMMNPPMSQPMPPSGPPMMPHGSMPPMSAASMAPQAQQGPQGHQPPTPQPHLTPMTNVPSTSPYMTQQAPGSLTSPGGASSPGGGPQQQQQPQQQQPQQPQQSPQQQQVATQQQQQQQQQQAGQQQQQQQAGQHGQQPQQPTQQQPPQHQQPQQQPTGQGTGGQQQGMGQPAHVGCPNSGPNCIRSGCTNPAVHNPEWEDEYCSNECVVSHCRDVFSTWVASNHHQPMNPTYPAPVK